MRCYETITNAYANEIFAAVVREEGRGGYRVLVGRPEGKRPLGRPRRRWEDNIKMDRIHGGDVCCGCITTQ
jgi:hypothetical protein